MTSTLRSLALLALGLGALLVPSSALAQDSDAAGEDCGGCKFLLTGPNYGNNDKPNVCGTDVRLTIMGMNGSCEADTDGGCDDVAPCFSMMQVDVRSNCPFTLDYEMGPLGGTTGRIPLPPSPGGVWTSILDPYFEPVGCASPMYIVRLEVQDTTGYMRFASAQYRCTACEE